MPRTKSYEPAKVLNEAMLLFWRNGFEATSIPKLEKHLGINRYSIYDTFNSKRELFLQALDLYTTKLIDTLVGPLESATGGLSDLEAFVARFEELFLGEEVPRGCLLCNTAIEVGAQDEEIARRVEGYFERVEKALYACLLRAQKLGELQTDRSVLRARARIVRLGIQGALMDLRLNRSPEHMRRALDALGAYVLGV